ncbi:hypothetical protein QBC45DRAFT_425403 [Copromyces sp. CBS 386.78]|nr:hypothetical protein QBC45DRAFT_425403 [Copromyces sp. CBS 386.78]
MTSAEEAEIEHPGKVPFLRVGLRWVHRIRLIAHGIRVCIAKCMLQPLVSQVWSF